MSSRPPNQPGRRRLHRKNTSAETCVRFKQHDILAGLGEQTGSAHTAKPATDDDRIVECQNLRRTLLIPTQLFRSPVMGCFYL